MSYCRGSTGLSIPNGRGIIWGKGASKCWIFPRKRVLVHLRTFEVHNNNTSVRKSLLWSPALMCAILNTSYVAYLLTYLKVFMDLTSFAWANVFHGQVSSAVPSPCEAICLTAVCLCSIELVKLETITDAHRRPDVIYHCTQCLRKQMQFVCIFFHICWISAENLNF